MSNLPILQKPPHLYLFTSLHKLKSYKYPSPSFFLHLLPFFFLASCSLQQRSRQGRAPSLASLVHPNSIFSTTSSLNSTTISSPSLCENRLLLLDWGRILLRWQDLGPVPSFWIGAETSLRRAQQGILSASDFPRQDFPNADLTPRLGNPLTHSARFCIDATRKP